MLKKTFLFLLISLFFLNTSKALNPGPLGQNLFNPQGSKYNIGFFIGPNITNITYDNRFLIGSSYLATTDWKTYFHYSLAGIYQYDESWSFQVELNSDFKGFGYSDQTFYPYNGLQLSTSLENQIKINYITIPLLAKYHFGRVLLGYVEAGPYFSILNRVDNKALYTIEGPAPTNPAIIQTYNYTFEGTSREGFGNDYGATVGAGLIVPLVKGIWGPKYSVFINARYSRGFSNLYRDVELEELNAVEEIIGMVPEFHDPRLSENDINSSTFTFRFGLVMAI